MPEMAAEKQLEPVTHPQKKCARLSEPATVALRACNRTHKQAAAEKQLEAALDTARAAEKRAVAAEARAAELETAAAEAAEASQGVRESVSAEVRGCLAQRVLHTVGT